MEMSGVSSTPEQTSASLYVGDLAQSVTDAILRETFTNVGTVVSVRVCRDRVTKQSLGYGYVNFQHPDVAARALDRMNGDSLHGHTIRISKVQRDPQLRRSGRGNVYIKNLDKWIDNKTLYNTLSTFGDIISCKVAQHQDGQSKGFGFVQFETEEAADRAIEKVNGMLLNDKQVVDKDLLFMEE